VISSKVSQTRDMESNKTRPIKIGIQVKDYKHNDNFIQFPLLQKNTNKDGGAPSLNLTSSNFYDSPIKSVLENCCLLRRWLANDRLRILF